MPKKLGSGLSQERGRISMLKLVLEVLHCGLLLEPGAYIGQMMRGIIKRGFPS